MTKLYQKQFNSRDRPDFLKDFDLNKDGYVTMREIKQHIQEKKADFKYLDLDGDGSITMKELITKLNPLASISEKDEIAAIVSSAPNFDLKDGNINMREMIAKSKSSAQGNLLRGIVNLLNAA